MGVGPPAQDDVGKEAQKEASCAGADHDARDVYGGTSRVFGEGLGTGEDVVGISSPS